MTRRTRARRTRLPRAMVGIDLHAIGKRWVDDGTSLSALARELGCAYTTLYGRLRALGYTLDAAVGARPGRRLDNMTNTRAADRVRHATLIRAEQDWAAALAGRRFADARVPPAHGRAPQPATVVERNSSLADL